MKIKGSVILKDEQVESIMREANLKTGEEVVAFLKGVYVSEAPEYADVFQFEIVKESEDTEEGI